MKSDRDLFENYQPDIVYDEIDGLRGNHIHGWVSTE